MTIYKKPDLKVFGANAKPTEMAEFEDLLRGWGITIEKTNGIPPMEWFNYLFNRLDGNINYLVQNGIVEYSSDLEYPSNAVVKSNGNLYKCVRQNTNKPLSNTTYWELLIKNATTSQSGIVQLSSSTNSTSEKTASTSLAVKKVNDLTNTKYDKNGGELNGSIIINDDNDYSSLSMINKENATFRLISERDGSANMGILQYIKNDEYTSVAIPKKNGKILLDTDKSSSIDDTSEDTIATSKAVYDLNELKYNKSGGELSGNISIDLKKDGAMLELLNKDKEKFQIIGERKDSVNMAVLRYDNTDAQLNVTIPKKNGKILLDTDNASVSVGAIEFIASDKGVKGRLKCDGGLYSTTTYADLFNVIGYTWGGSGSRFAVPNLTDKARFLRSSGNNLKVGTYQNDAIREITGEMRIANDGTSEFADSLTASGAFEVIKGNAKRISQGTNGKEAIGVTFKASRTVPTADENRPYSAVVAYWIKY